MSSAPTTFAGLSKYSADLQKVLTRAVGIASLPLNQLNAQLTQLQSRSTAIDTLNTNFVAIQTSLDGLNSGITSATSTVSNKDVISAVADPSTLSGSYTINVIDPGSQSTTISKTGLTTVTDPSTQSITAATSLTLTVGGATFTLTPSSNSLNSLAEAINSSGAGLTATIINVGPPAAPDYRLAVQSEALGPVAIQINDGSQDVLDVLVSGTLATYQVNGLPAVPISSNARRITVAPGLTAVLLAAGTSTIVVSRTSAALSNALSSFVAAYNAAVDGLNVHRGNAGGALTADPIISTLTRSLRNLNSYSGGSGAVLSLPDLGVSLDKNGKLSLNQGTLNAVAAAHPNDVAAFLGTASTGGFLKVAADTLTSLEDPVNGTFPSMHAELQTEIAKQNQAISDMQDRIDLMQANLTARISAADALIASLEQQVSYFTTLFDSINSNGNSSQNK